MWVYGLDWAGPGYGEVGRTATLTSEVFFYIFIQQI
jgi:hypothetical protein